MSDTSWREAAARVRGIRDPTHQCTLCELLEPWAANFAALPRDDAACDDAKHVCVVAEIGDEARRVHEARRKILAGPILRTQHGFAGAGDRHGR